MTGANGKTSIIINYAEREVTPAFTLHQIGRYALSKAQTTEKGSLLEIITALLMCPLTMEAVLNHIDRKVFDEGEGTEKSVFWESVERQPPFYKLKLFAQRFKLKVNFDEPPFEDFDEMFKFRNQVLYAKTLTLKAYNIQANLLYDTPGLDQIPALQAEWEQQCKIETAIRWRDSVERMAQCLCEIAGCANPIRSGYMSQWSA
jgi:hypothetical protein